VGAGSLLVFNGCGLSDRQLAGVWQSVLSTGLDSVISNAISTWFGIAQALITAATGA
jgi:hypothetical protein